MTRGTYSAICDTCLLSLLAAVETSCTIRPYEPEAKVVHPGGGGAGGAIEAVTACRANSCFNGFAKAEATARASKMDVYCIVLVIEGRMKIFSVEGK